MISEPMVRSAQTVDQNELPLVPRQQHVPSGLFKMISEPMVCLALTMHLSCTDTYTVSKQTETRFHMTHAYGMFGANRAPILRLD
jgi:hypothetical protein